MTDKFSKTIGGFSLKNIMKNVTPAFTVMAVGVLGAYMVYNVYFSDRVASSITSIEPAAGYETSMEDAMHEEGADHMEAAEEHMEAAKEHMDEAMDAMEDAGEVMYSSADEMSEEMHDHDHEHMMDEAEEHMDEAEEHMEDAADHMEEHHEGHHDH